VSTSGPHSQPDHPNARMVDALNDLRDALVKLSLFAQDFQFEFDAEQRQAITEQSHELIERIKPR
jgi:hypothetical protein